MREHRSRAVCWSWFFTVDNRFTVLVSSIGCLLKDVRKHTQSLEVLEEQRGWPSWNTPRIFLHSCFGHCYCHHQNHASSTVFRCSDHCRFRPRYLCCHTLKRCLCSAHFLMWFYGDLVQLWVCLVAQVRPYFFILETKEIEKGGLFLYWQGKIHNVGNNLNLKAFRIYWALTRDRCPL